ncbi:MAG: site-specific integrase [Bacteroidota bacterium]|nr:site-specific integrase [Bacteroidota bacterium]
MNATTAIILDKRIKTKNDTYAVKLRVTFNRKQQYYPLNFHLTLEDWDKAQLPNLRGDLKQMKLVCNKFEQKAVEIIRELPSFTFAAFEKRFLNNSHEEKADVFTYFEKYVSDLRKQDRIGTASSYNNALVSLKLFIDDKRRKILPFEHITVEFLNQYQSWMQNRGNSMTTVGIYLRSLRTILNQAIEKGHLKTEDYPFGIRKYQIPASRNIKKALTKADIKKIVEYIPKTEAEGRARDLWLFSYLCNGANIKDLALLKYKNIDNKSIQFIRSKTERSTKQDLKPILVMRIPKINELLDKYGAKPIQSNEYVFGLISDKDDSAKRKAKINQATKTINKYMKRIGKALDIELELTTYTARHSFATIMKRSGASTEMISESLGHKDKKTTDNYLDSFEDDVKTAFQHKLMEF